MTHTSAHIAHRQTTSRASTGHKRLVPTPLRTHSLVGLCMVLRLGNRGNRHRINVFIVWSRLTLTGASILATCHVVDWARTLNVSFHWLPRRARVVRGHLRIVSVDNHQRRLTRVGGLGRHMFVHKRSDFVEAISKPARNSVAFALCCRRLGFIRRQLKHANLTKQLHHVLVERACIGVALDDEGDPRLAKVIYEADGAYGGSGRSLPIATARA